MTGSGWLFSVGVFLCLFSDLALSRSATAVLGSDSASDRTGLLIVAPGNFHSALKEFVIYKQQTRAVRLVPLEDAMRGQPGVDDPERLKRFLYGQWCEGATGYVLLVGDVDIMPVRFMVLDRVTEAAFDYAFYPSDLYYSDLAKADGSFENWNAVTNGFHAGYLGEVRGEKNKSDPINFDAVDYRPEIAVGRWPVSTPEEARRVAEKTLRYEKKLEAAEKGTARAGFVAVGGWVDTRRQMDRLAGRLPPGWLTEKRYFTDTKLDPGTPRPDRVQVVGLFNEGIDLVVHTGHGQPHEWEQCLSVQDLKRLTNSSRLPVVISAGCSTATFAPMPPYQPYVDVDGVEHRGTDGGQVFTAPPPPPAPYQRGKYNPGGLGEQLVKMESGGAVVYIGCNTGSQPCALTLLDGFFEGVRKPRARVGDAWNDALRYYYQRERLDRLVPTESWYPASIFFQGMKFMLFGDPTLPVAR